MDILLCFRNGSEDDPQSECFDAKWLDDHGYRLPEGITVDLLNKHWWSHVFICFNGKYYDAEFPEGVDTPFALPLVLNNLRLNCQLTVD